MADTQVAADPIVDGNTSKAPATIPQLVAAFVLLAAYAAIPSIGFAAGLLQVITDPSHLIINDTAVVSFLTALSSQGEAAAQLLPKLLLPLTAVFTGASIDRVRSTSALNWLFAIPLIGVLASLSLSVLFTMASSEDIAKPAIVSLGYEMATNMGTYLMLTLGLQATKQGQN